MVGRHHRLNGHEFEQTLGDGEGQGSLLCCTGSHKESDTTQQLNNRIERFLFHNWNQLFLNDNLGLYFFLLGVKLHRISAGWRGLGNFWILAKCLVSISRCETAYSSCGQRNIEARAPAPGYASQRNALAVQWVLWKEGDGGQAVAWFLPHSVTTGRILSLSTQLFHTLPWLTRDVSGVSGVRHPEHVLLVWRTVKGSGWEPLKSWVRGVSGCEGNVTFFFKMVKLTQKHIGFVVCFLNSFKRSVEFVVVRGKPRSFLEKTQMRWMHTAGDVFYPNARKSSS